MSISTKNSLILACVFVCLVGVSLAVQRFVLAPSFAELERKQALTDGGRCVQAVEREVTHLSGVGMEWSDWDDLYAYVQDRNEDFVKANLASADYFKNANIPVMFILDAGNRVIWSTCLDLESMSQVELSAFPREAFPTGHPLTTTTDPNGHIAGVLLTERGPALVSSRPIRRTDSKGEIRGRFIIARYLNEALVQLMRDQTAVAFDVWSNRDAPLDGAPALPPGGPAEGAVLLAPADPGTLHVYNRLPCITSGDELVFRASIPREITEHGRAAVSSALWILVGGGAAVLAALVFALRRIVIRPLRALAAHARRVGSTGDLTARLALDRNDEIGLLAEEFDRMTGRLSEAQASLADASRSAGMAEVASGVLHNVGNVLNNVALSMHGVREIVAKSRIEGFIKVSGLLKEHRSDLPAFFRDDPRAGPLPEYLDRLSEAVRAEHAELARDVARLSEGIEHIVDIVGQQQSIARSKQVLEAVDVPEVIKAAARMVRASCERHGATLEIDAPAPLRTLVDRARLQQVIVNLLTNAIEAAKQAAADRRCIRVALSPEGERFRIEVLDQGIGFDAATRPRLFQQGFTTRPDGHGLGLHFCALAAGQMGGTISAESPGAGMGATFTLRLPVRRDEARIAA